MASELVLIFTKDNMQKLMDANPDKIVVRTTIEEATLQDGNKAGVVRVWADARQKGVSEALVTVPGCPDPPCAPDGD